MKRKVVQPRMDVNSNLWNDSVTLTNQNGQLIITDICRICGSSEGELLPIYEGEGLLRQLAPKIQQYLPIKMFENDSLPKQVCYKCASTIVAWHDMTVRCVKVEEKFHDILRSLKLQSLSKCGDNQQDGCLQELPDNFCGSNRESSAVENCLQEENEILEPDVESCSARSQPMSSSNIWDARSTAPKSKYYALFVDKYLITQMCVYEGQDDVVNATVSSVPSLSEINEVEDNIESDISNEGYRNCLNSRDSFQLDTDHNYVLANADVLANELAASGTFIHPRTLDYNTGFLGVHFCEYSTKSSYVLKVVSGPCRLTHIVVKWKSISLHKRVYCELCNKGFGNKAVLQTHMRFHIGITPFYCKFCGVSFHLSLALKQHLKVCRDDCSATIDHPVVKGEDNKYECALCGKKYKLKPSLKEHLRQHIGKARLKLKCQICGMKFLKRADIMKHMKSHENQGLLQCSHYPCDKRFLNKKDLQDHVISHSDKRPFSCDLCGLTYKRKSHLSRHMTNHSSCKKGGRGDAQGQYQCEKCGRVSRSKRLHQVHMICHSGERHFECPQCHKRFAQSGAVSRHVHTVHGGARDFTCEVCGKSFTAKATKENHMRIHTGEKPFQCTQCGKTFRTQQQHKVHEKIHSDVRPYACQYCPKRFRRRPHLVVHIRTHTGEKPYACPECGRRFAQRNDMNKHMNIHRKSNKSSLWAVFQKSL